MDIYIMSAPRSAEDYRWYPSEPDKVTLDKCCSVLYGVSNALSLVVVQRGLKYDVLLGNLPLTVYDSHGRLISCSYLLLGLTERAARNIAMCYLLSPEQLQKELTGDHILKVSADKVDVSIPTADSVLWPITEKFPDYSEPVRHDLPTQKREAAEWLQKHSLRSLEGVRLVFADVVRLEAAEDADLVVYEEGCITYDSKQHNPKGPEAPGLERGLLDALRENWHIAVCFAAVAAVILLCCHWGSDRAPSKSTYPVGGEVPVAVPSPHPDNSSRQIKSKEKVTTPKKQENSFSVQTESSSADESHEMMKSDNVSVEEISATNL